MPDTTRRSILAYEPGMTILFPSQHSCMEYYGIRSTRMLKLRIAWEGSFLDYATEPSKWNEPMVLLPNGEAVPLRHYNRRKRRQ